MGAVRASGFESHGACLKGESVVGSQSACAPDARWSFRAGSPIRKGWPRGVRLMVGNEKREDLNKVLSATTAAVKLAFRAINEGRGDSPCLITADFKSDFENLKLYLQD